MGKGQRTTLGIRDMHGMAGRLDVEAIRVFGVSSPTPSGFWPIPATEGCYHTCFLHGSVLQRSSAITLTRPLWGDWA